VLYLRGGALLEQIRHEECLLAIIIRRNFEMSGIQFFTPDSFSQQLAYMKRPKDYIIAPHVHNPVERTVQYTKEVLYIKKGRIRVDFYNQDKIYLFSSTLLTGDVILLAFGGHGFEFLEETEIIEIKQGPYAGAKDKISFEPIGKEKINMKEA